MIAAVEGVDQSFSHFRHFQRCVVAPTFVASMERECLPDGVQYCFAHGLTDWWSSVARCQTNTLCLVWPLSTQPWRTSISLHLLEGIWEEQSIYIGLRVYHHDRVRITGPLSINTDMDRRPAPHRFDAHPQRTVFLVIFIRSLTYTQGSFLFTRIGIDRSLPVNSVFKLFAVQKHLKTTCIGFQSDKKQRVIMSNEDDHCFIDHCKKHVHTMSLMRKWKVELILIHNFTYLVIALPCKYGMRNMSTKEILTRWMFSMVMTAYLNFFII